MSALGTEKIGIRYLHASFVASSLELYTVYTSCEIKYHAARALASQLPAADTTDTLYPKHIRAHSKLFGGGMECFLVKRA